MFYKLAFKNVKKSLSDYVIYFLTLSFGVCLFYVFNAVEAQQTMLLLSEQQHALLQTGTAMLGYLSVFISFVLAGLILYANNFLIKRRKRELGLYMTLGMGSGQNLSHPHGRNLCDRPILPWRGPFNRHCRITGHERFDGKTDERADQGFRVFLF